MSHRPRKTTELGNESGSRSRISRIAQPTRRVSNNTRSLDRLSSCENLAAKNPYLPSSSKKPRSTSATPQRTPNRLIRTPNRPIQGITQLTAEKERANDKIWISSESARINEYLRILEPTLGKDFFDRGGIKSMSTKQFIIIINYFLKKIVGNRLSVESNHVESISKILNEINYPYTVNKSWLKTPCAPHAFHNVVNIFSWFLTFFPTNPLTTTANRIEEYENLQVTETNDFPDKEFSCKFVRRTREIFSAWNNGSDSLVEEAKVNMINELIYKNCYLKNVNELDKNLDKLRTEYTEIKNIMKTNTRIEEYNRLDNEVMLNVRKTSKLKKYCNTYKNEIKDLESQIDCKLKLIESTENRINKIETVIQNQTLNVQKRNKLLKEVENSNQDLIALKKNITNLQEDGSSDQINLSRLILRKTELVTKLNMFVYQLFTQLKLPHNFKESQLAKDCTIEDAGNMILLLKSISEKIEMEIERLEKEVKENVKCLDLLKIENEKQLQPLLNKLLCKIKQNEENHCTIDKKHLELKSCFEEYIKEQTIKINELEMEKKRLIQELKIKDNQLKQYKIQNVKEWNKIESKLEETLKYQEERATELAEVVDDFHQTMEDLCSLLQNKLSK